MKEKLEDIAHYYPRWMNDADFVVSQEFQRLIVRAALHAKKRRQDDRWKIDASSILRDYEALRLRITSQELSQCA